MATKNLHNTTTHEQRAMDTIFGLTGCICFVIGTTGSSIILSYFLSKIIKSKNKTASTFLYICISYTDVMLSILVLSNSLSEFKSGDPVLFANDLYCTVWGFLWNLFSAISIFLIAVLSIARTVSSVFPFVKVRKRFVAIPVLVYFVLLVIEYSLPIIYGQEGYRYFDNHRLCGFTITDLFPYPSIKYELLLHWVLLVNYLLPLALILISCAVTVYKLKRPTLVRDTSQGSLKHHATVTVLLLTFVYSVFNIPACIIWASSLSWVDNQFSLHAWLVEHLGRNRVTGFAKLLNFYSVALNSMFNCLVYFYRIKNIQMYFKKIVFGIKTFSIHVVSVYNKPSDMIIVNKTRSNINIQLNPPKPKLKYCRSFSCPG